MSKELKPCPFCGGEVIHSLMMDGMNAFYCANPKCGANIRFPEDQARAVPSEIESAEIKFNSRYERTCHNVNTAAPDWVFGCSECEGAMTGNVILFTNGGQPTRTVLPSYCPNCGAKVVRNGA